MPFKSEAQRAYLFSRNPRVAKKFAEETPKGKKLPSKIATRMPKKNKRSKRAIKK